MKEKIRDNGEKIKQNKVLPYLVGNVVEVTRVYGFLGIVFNFSIDPRRGSRRRRRWCEPRP
jgi:hypothetical protein